jgi:hypothetical protein
MYDQGRRSQRLPAPPEEPPSSAWPESELAEWSYQEEAYAVPRQSIGDWITSLSPAQQLGYGCVGVMMVGALVLYCLAGAAWVARPALLQRPPTPTELVRPTLAPTPTQIVQPTIGSLPRTTLVATPTQAPIPTREPPTPTLLPGELPPGTNGPYSPLGRSSPALPPGVRPGLTPSPTQTIRSGSVPPPGARPSPTRRPGSPSSPRYEFEWDAR